MKALSEKAKETYFLINKYLQKKGKAPTIQEIAKTFSISTRKTLEILRELEDSLIIKRSPYKSRSIEIIAPIEKETGRIEEVTKRVPILGTAPGGPFLFAKQNIEGNISIPVRLLKGKSEIFLLRVIGNSMSPYLEDGDLALIKKQEYADNRDIIVAVTQGPSNEYEATIKQFYCSKNQIILNPLNTKEYKPIVGSSDTIKVQGKVVGAIKSFQE